MAEHSAPTAIVTGAAHGIGLATAQRLSLRGWGVAAVDVDADRLQAAPLSPDVLRVVADIADEPDSWLADVEARLGIPTVLVNNAAHEDDRSFLELPMGAVRRSLDITLLGTWALTRSVVGLMIDRGVGGSIVFNLSLHARRVRLVPSYSVAKAGLAMLVKELANELGPHGIRVNAVSPGAVDTWSDPTPEPAEHRFRSEGVVPLGRLGAPGDIAKAVEFLVDDTASAYITGANLDVDGGLDQFNWLHHLYGTAEAERRTTTKSDPT
jgi:NAD(P)-dependent dehydrogenase (short-subunit alcohol dehydrogenase family)